MNKELQHDLYLKTGVGLNIAFQAQPAARNSALLALPLWLAQLHFFHALFKHKVICVIKVSQTPTCDIIITNIIITLVSSLQLIVRFI